MFCVAKFSKKKIERRTIGCTRMNMILVCTAHAYNNVTMESSRGRGLN